MAFEWLATLYRNWIEEFLRPIDLWGRCCSVAGAFKHGASFRFEFSHARSEHPEHFIEVLCEPVMLMRPILFVGGVRIE
jgi:hypothetical protein